MLATSKSISGFDPRSIVGCRLWLDGADPLAGALPSNGATVSTWYDKSGNGYNAPATVSGATFTAASQNGNGYITFPTGKYFTTSNFILSSTNTPTIFLVCQQTGYGSGNSDIISASTGTPYSYYTLDIYGNSGTKNLAVNMWSNVNVNGNISIANPTVISIVGSGSPTYSVTMWGNGTSNVTFTGYASNPLSTSNSFWIGAISAGFIGNIYEVLFYDTAFTSSQRQSVEGYLAWKWGLQVQTPVAPVLTPLSVPGCQLWLDAADKTKIAPSAGGTLTSWTDKSGTGKTVTVASAPTYSLTAFNGLPCLTFASGNSLTIPITAPGTNDIAIFAVWKLTDGTASRDILSIGAPGGSETAIGWNSSAANYLMYRYGGAQSTAPTSYSSNITIVQSGTQVSGYRTVYINGTSPSTTGTETYNQTNTSIYIGGGGNAFVLPLIGQVAEIIYYQATLSTTQRQSVENYLMGKWGIKPSLPATHPFYSLPAFSRPFGPTDIPGCALWLDAADSSTMNSTTTVTSWTDKSGLGNTMTGTATVSGSNMTFNGSTQAFSNTTFVFPSSNYSMFAVYSNTTAPASTAYMNVVYGSGGYPMVGVYDVNKYVSARSVVANTGALSPNVAASSTVLVSATYTPSTFSPFINGSTETTLAGTTLAATGLYVGGPTNYFNGSVSEILIYSSNLSTTQRQQVEGYLAAKWGLLSSVVSGHPFKSIPPSTSQPPQFQEVTPGNWTRDWQPSLTTLSAGNSSGLTITTSNITGGATFIGSGWTGSVLAQNGNIYFTPFYATNILVLNPTTETTSNLTGGATFPGGGSWIGGVLAPNGNIYFCPQNASNILVLNPTTGVTSNLTGGATYTTGGWIGGVLAPNGNIYFSPYQAANILVLNPTTGVTSNITGGATFPVNSASWTGSVLAPNGNIYSVPYGAANILVLNPITGVTSNLTGGATYTTGGWYGGVLAPNGNIYFCPHNAANILVLNPTTGVTSNLTGGATYTTGGWMGGVLGPNGNIYFTPFSATNILVLNPTTGVTSNLTGGATFAGGGSWYGGKLAPNGTIYFSPFGTANILKLAFAGLSQTPSSNCCLSAFLNKY